ncbi:MAG: hypothetical protein ABFD69_16230 [Candidatus Sumerlaeia bacterium]
MAASQQVNTRSGGGLARGAACFAASYAVMVALFWPDLASFFVGDDIASLAMAAPQAGGGGLGMFAPQGNGFWRPAYLLLERLVTTFFGLSPLAFHLAALVPPALAAVLTGALARRVWPRSRWAAPLACMLLTAHIVTWFVGITISNSCDSLLAVGLLAGLLCWDEWLASQKFRWAAGAALAWVLAVMAKETGVIFPVLLTLWTIGLDRGSRRPWRALACFWGASFIHGGAIAFLQIHTASSYTTGGAFTPSPKNFLRQLTDYYDSLFIPYLHLIDWPLISVALPSAAYWALRLTTAIALVAIVWRFVKTRGPRPMLTLLVMAAVPLLLASLMRDKPQGRFAYPSMPFIVLALVGVLVNSRFRRPVAAVIAMLWMAFIASFFVSRDIASRRELTAPIGRFTAAIEAESAHWKPGATVAIYDHPHPGGEPWRRIYAQLHADVFLHGKRAKIVLDQTPAGTDYAYRFEDPKLVRIEWPARPPAPR